MGDPSRVPSAEELERLTHAFQSNPASGAFVSLGEAFILLGRPRDAIEVGATGLRANPESVEGRIMVATAFAQLHKWKEAQAELLKVVKKDRNNARGFRLLGEVLMRRADYERALPVLQHAQNLSPADPSILSLLRRARANQPLDPPPPIPTPLSPRGNGHGAAGDARPMTDEFEQLPTRVASDAYKASALNAETYDADQQALGRMELEKRQQAGPAAPQERSSRQRPDARGRDDDAPARPVEHHAPPPAEDPFAPLTQRGAAVSRPPAPPPARPQPPMEVRGSSPMPAMEPQDAERQKRPSAAPPPSVRPRVLSAQKPKAAAQTALRQSAAVGEQYLNNLLTAGLLDVPNVRARDVDFDVAPDRTWGRSTKRMFIYLFVLLVVGVGGAGGWYWYSEKQKAEDVARLLGEAKALVDSGDYDDLYKGGELARSAMKLDPDSSYAIAVYAENTGLAALLYEELDANEVERAMELIKKQIKTVSDLGYRETLVGRSAATLALLDELEDDAVGRLKETKSQLEEYLKTSPDDRLARWLLARVFLAEGDREKAKVSLEQAYSRGEGPVIAGIELADLILDDGDFAGALDLYNKALEKSPQHLLAYSGRSLARSERSADPDEAISDLNVGLADPKGLRVAAYKSLGLATAWLQQEDYEAFKRDLDQASGTRVFEPRYLVRVALLRVAQGKLGEAGEIRARIKWYSDKPQEHPLVAILDAQLLHELAGLPTEALTKIGKREGLRASKLRGRALFDLGKTKEALLQLEDALAIAPDDMEAQVWAAACRILGDGDERRKAIDELDRLARKAKTKSVKVVQGIALARIGDDKAARTELEASLDGITDEYPNPLEYRGRIALAEIEFKEGALDKAIDQLEKAFKLAPGYLPAQDLKCRILAATIEPAQARESCTAVVNAGVATWGAELALVKSFAPIDAEEKPEAIKGITRAKEKGAPIPALQEVILLLADETVFDQMGVPKPKP